MPHGRVRNEQSSRSDTHSHSMSKSLLTSTPPTASSSCTMLDQTPTVSSSQMTLDKTPKKSFGKRRILGSDAMIDLDCLNLRQLRLLLSAAQQINSYWASLPPLKMRKHSYSTSMRRHLKTLRKQRSVQPPNRPQNANA